jgi:hypothetical protein
MKVALLAILIFGAVIARGLPPELMAPDQRALQAYIDSQHIVYGQNMPIPHEEIVGPDDPQFQQLIAEGWTFVGYDFERTLYSDKASAVFIRCIVPFRPERKKLAGAGNWKPAPKPAFSSLKEFYQECLLPIWVHFSNAQETETIRTPEMLYQEWMRPSLQIPFREHDPLEGLPLIDRLYRQTPITTSRTR